MGEERRGDGLTTVGTVDAGGQAVGGWGGGMGGSVVGASHLKLTSVVAKESVGFRFFSLAERLLNFSRWARFSRRL